MGTSELVRVRGHPESVLKTARILEREGVLNRARLPRGRHEVQSRLTLPGLELVETPLYRWPRLLRKWTRLKE